MFVTLLAMFLVGAFCGVIGTVLVGSNIETRTENRLNLENELELAKLTRALAEII